MAKEREATSWRSWGEVQAATAERSKWRHFVEALCVMRYQTEIDQNWFNHSKDGNLFLGKHWLLCFKTQDMRMCLPTFENYQGTLGFL